MAKGILYVETRPNSPEEAAAYHQWYEETHIPEICAVEGFVSARRFTPLDDGGPFVAIYEMEGDDLEAIRARLTEAVKSGATTAPVGVQMDPPPVQRVYEQRLVYAPDAVQR